LMDTGDFSGAASAYKDLLERDPTSDFARYGYCMALAYLGKIEEASRMAASIQASAFRAEAQAAMIFLSQPDDARERIEAIAGTVTTKFIESLLARLVFLEGNPDQAARRLSGLGAEQFRFARQYTEALDTLGKAQYHLNQNAAAKETFEALSQIASGGSKMTAKAYLAEIASRLDETRREDIRARATEIRKLIDQAEEPGEITDEWTSRPLTFVILPGEVKRSRLAIESGLTDLLPSLLGGRLVTDSPMRMVDRELIRELLAEQELSAMLSSREGQLRLGRVLGARLLLKCDFVVIGTNEKLLVTMNDTETTERIPIPVMDIPSPVAVDDVAALLSVSIWEKVREFYPVQGRLYAGTDGPEINVGATVGVRPGMTFEILGDIDAPPIPGAMASLQDTPGSATSRVTVTGVDMANLSTAPESGWFVRQQLNGIK
jgi:hypothetical protein